MVLIATFFTFPDVAAESTHVCNLHMYTYNSNDVFSNIVNDNYNKCSKINIILIRNVYQMPLL